MIETTEQRMAAELQALRQENDRLKGLLGQIEAHVTRLNADSAEWERQKQELEAANALLATLATVDGLTGLKNHRAFQERLDQEYQRAIRYDLPLSLVLLDVDLFKPYNDSYGHPAGDEVLQTVGNLLLGSARATDFVSRYGGEEFAVILPNTDADGAVTMAERFRESIRSWPWRERTITASFGVASLNRLTSDRIRLLRDADQALYTSKQCGRNRTTHYRDLATSSG